MSPCLRKRLWLLLAALLLAAAAGWWLRPAAVEPPMPADVQDPEVLQVLEAARQEVRDHPRSAAAWGELGKKLLAHLCCPEASRCFGEAARLEPTNARWPYLRAMIAIRLDPHPDNVVPFLRQAMKAGTDAPELAVVRLRLAEALLEREDWDEAEALFREELRRQSDPARAALGLGMIARARGNDREAEHYMNLALGSPSSRKRAMAQLAALALVRGDVATAGRYEELVARLPGDEPWPDPLFGDVFQFGVGHRFQTLEVENLEAEHRFLEAAAVYLEKAERHPTAAAYAGAGFNLARAGNLDQAVPLLRKAVQLDPKDSNAHYRLAQALYTQAEQHPVESADAREGFRAAAAAAEQATQGKVDHASAYLIWGRALLKLGEPAAAVKPLQQGVACRPERFDLQLALGEALLEAGRYAEAATHLENARKLQPNDHRPARALEKLGK